MKHIAIIGNGAYGTALAHLFGQKHRISIFSREPKNNFEHHLDEFENYSTEFDYIIIAITTKGLSDVLPKIAPSIGNSAHIILAMKGFTGLGKLPVSEALEYFSDDKVSILSGPGFAHEILENIPVHLVLASLESFELFESDFDLENLRLDFSPDIFGISWCGVLKNIYAIGAGMASKSGDFDRRSYTDSVVAEMAEILSKLGYDSNSAYGQAGSGDMWICTTPNSRNFRFGTGEYDLMEQSEGYHASISVAKLLSPHSPQENFPIISEIISTIDTIPGKPSL